MASDPFPDPKKPSAFPLFSPPARRRRWIVILLLLAAFAGGGSYAYYKFRPSLQKGSIRFETLRVERGTIVAKVTATGTLSALVTVQVGSQVSGTIKEILADFNAEVIKGQVLARIDPRLFDAALAQAKANVTASKGNLAKSQAQAKDAERQFERAKVLAAKDISAQADVDTAQATADAAKAQVEASEGSLAQANAALNQAEVNLEYSTIVSPINGIVISRNVDVGQTVAASLQAPTLFVIAEDLRRMQVDTSVAESDVGKLRSGMEATFTVEAFLAKKFRGTIRQVRYSPQTVQNVVTYDAVIDVENPDLQLKPGMTASVTFVYQQKDDVLRVPNAAFRFHPSQGVLLASARPAAAGGAGALPDSGQNRPGTGGSQEPKASSGGTARDDVPPDGRTVWVLRDGEPQAVTIRTGLSDYTFSEMVEGPLQAGDQVITDSIGEESGGGGTRGPSGGIRRLF